MYIRRSVMGMWHSLESLVSPLKFTDAWIGVEGRIIQNCGVRGRALVIVMLSPPKKKGGGASSILNEVASIWIMSVVQRLLKLLKVYIFSLQFSCLPTTLPPWSVPFYFFFCPRLAPIEYCKCQMIYVIVYYCLVLLWIMYRLI